VPMPRMGASPADRAAGAGPTGEEPPRKERTAIVHHPDTCYAVVEAERKLALQCAERRARLAEATRRPRLAPSVVPAWGTTARPDRLGRAVRSLRWVLQPLHA
jgi:hypothetical protein